MTASCFTDVSTPVGTPPYMSPETIVCTDLGVDPMKADVFSYGVLLWEIVTQQQPDLIKQEGLVVGNVPTQLFSSLHLLLISGKRLRFEGIIATYLTQNNPPSLHAKALFLSFRFSCFFSSFFLSFTDVRSL